MIELNNHQISNWGLDNVATSMARAISYHFSQTSILENQTVYFVKQNLYSLAKQ